MSRACCLLIVLCASLASALAAAPPLTIAEARNSADAAVRQLIQLHEDLADNYFHAGKWEQAVAMLDRITVLEPAGTDAYANAAWLLWSSGQLDAAMDFYRRMIDANPTDPEAYYIVGNMFFFRRQYAEALPLRHDVGNRRKYGEHCDREPGLGKFHPQRSIP